MAEVTEVTGQHEMATRSDQSSHINIKETEGNIKKRDVKKNEFLHVAVTRSKTIDCACDERRIVMAVVSAGLAMSALTNDTAQMPTGGTVPVPRSVRPAVAWHLPR